MGSFLVLIAPSCQDLQVDIPLVPLYNHDDHDRTLAMMHCLYLTTYLWVSYLVLLSSVVRQGKK
jgi:hypothetical protein